MALLVTGNFSEFITTMLTQTEKLAEIFQAVHTFLCLEMHFDRWRRFFIHSSNKINTGALQFSQVIFQDKKLMIFEKFLWNSFLRFLNVILNICLPIILPTKILKSKVNLETLNTSDVSGMCFCSCFRMMVTLFQKSVQKLLSAFNLCCTEIFLLDHGSVKY